MTLIESIRQGESKTLELKAKLPQNDQIAKTVVAFANSSGGKLVIGVGDNRDVIGLPEQDLFALQERIGSLIFDRCHPAILPEMYTANLEGKTVLVVEIFRGNLLPYHLKEDGKNNGTYLRVGTANRKADFEHILELERQKRNQSFDEEIFREQPLAGLDLTPLLARFEALGKPLNDEKLRNLNLVREEQGTLYPTQGLMILLGKLPHVTVKCARFKGKDMRVFLDRKEYDGDLFTQLEQMEGFVKNHISLRGEIKGLQRTDTYEIPEAALREALINALIHRDYTNQGRDIKVGVYDDIVNVVSPGGFPSTLTSEALQEGRSEIRNRVVARIFKELGYIEQWGSGIQRIKTACTAIGLTEPRIREKGDFVDVEFYRPVVDANEYERNRTITNEKVSDTAGLVPDTGEKVSDSTGKVPDTTQNRPITNDYERLRTIKNAKVSDTAGSVPDINPKVPDSSGLVPDTGTKVPDKPNRERLGPSVNDYERLGLPANDYDRLRTIISQPAQLKPGEAKILLHLIEHRKTGRKEAAKLLGLGNTKTYTLFDGLIQKGLILRRGQGRSTYYVLAQPPQGGSNV